MNHGSNYCGDALYIGAADFACNLPRGHEGACEPERHNVIEELAYYAETVWRLSTWLKEHPEGTPPARPGQPTNTKGEA